MDPISQNFKHAHFLIICDSTFLLNANILKNLCRITAFMRIKNPKYFSPCLKFDNNLTWPVYVQNKPRISSNAWRHQRILWRAARWRAKSWDKDCNRCELRQKNFNSKKLLSTTHEGFLDISFRLIWRSTFQMYCAQMEFQSEVNKIRQQLISIQTPEIQRSHRVVYLLNEKIQLKKLHKFFQQNRK